MNRKDTIEWQKTISQYNNRFEPTRRLSHGLRKIKAAKHCSCANRAPGLPPRGSSARYTGVRVTPSNLFVCFLPSSKFFVFWKSLSIEPYAFFEDAFDKRSALFLFGYEIYFFYLVPRTNRLNKFLISCFLKIYIDWNARFFTILSKTDRRRPDYWQQ